MKAMSFFDMQFWVLTIFGLAAVLLIAGRTLWIRKKRPSEKWNWGHTFVSVFASVILSLVTASLLSRWVTIQDQREQYLRMEDDLYQELGVIRDHLMQSDVTETTILTPDHKDTAISYRVTYVQAIACERALQSGLLDSVKAYTCLRLAMEIKSYNVKLEYAMNCLSLSGASAFDAGRLKTTLTQLDVEYNRIIGLCSDFQDAILTTRDIRRKR